VKTIILVPGVIAVLLGGLWLLQGLGLVHIRPILCFADCEPIVGPSPGWAIAGAVALVAGGLAVLWSLGRRPPRR
jgi:hypothetical protein